MTGRSSAVQKRVDRAVASLPTPENEQLAEHQLTLTAARACQESESAAFCRATGAYIRAPLEGG